MFDIFSKKPEINQKLHISTRHNYVTRRLEEAQLRLAYYFRSSVYVTESDHILIQIIRQVNTVYSGNDEQYYYAVKSRVDKIASSLKINTSVHRMGALGKNHFFGKGVSEFLIAREGKYPSGLDSKEYWQDFQPVKVIWHPYSDLTLNIRDGSDTEGVDGYAIITVDIPLLLLQYVRWRLHAEKYFEVQPTHSQFVFQYPLVNMLQSDIDVSYFNRLYNKSIGRKNIPQRKRYGLSLNDVTNYIDEEQSTFLDNVSKSPVSFIDISQGTPMVFTPMVWDFLQLPSQNFTRSNSPFYLLGYLPYMAFLANLSFQSGSANNGDTGLYLRKEYRRFKNMGWLSNIPGVNTASTELYIEDNILKYLP